MKFSKACFALAGVFALSVSGNPARADDDAADARTPEKIEKIKVELPSFTLLVPANWRREPPTTRFRLTQFQIPAAEGDAQPAELAVYHFGSRAGGADASIRRWINEFGNRDRRLKVVKGVSPHGPYYLVDIHGIYHKPVGPPVRRQTEDVPNARMLAIILVTEDHGNYFLKLAGPEKTVSAQLQALRASIAGDQETEEYYEYP